MVNPFRAKAVAARARYERLSGTTAHDKAMESAFPLGAGFGRGKARERRLESTITRATKAIAALRDAEWLEAQAAAFDAGRINQHGRRPAKNAAEAKARREALTQRAADAWAQREGKEVWQVPGSVYADSGRAFGGEARKLLLSEHAEKVVEAMNQGHVIPEEVLAELPALPTTGKDN